MDDNCNSLVDEGIQNTYYRDADNDTYRSSANGVQACTLPSAYVMNNSDCNNSNSAIHPGETEVCDGVDNDCDGQIGEEMQNA